MPTALMLTSLELAVSQVKVIGCPFSITCGIAVSEAMGAAGAGGGGTVEAICALWHALRIATALKIRISIMRISTLSFSFLYLRL